MKKERNNWNKIFERFNNEVADKENNFVTASQLAEWLEKNYKIPCKKENTL